MLNKLIFLFILILVFFGCSGNENSIRETILAKVGDKTISVNEFIRRAEYTIRPVWCRNDDYIARKIVLNSLIAEKLLALEAGQPQKIIKNEEISLYLQGRKEQAMRKIHYNENALKKVNLAELDLQTAVQMAERTYKVKIIPINDEDLAQRIKGDLLSKKTSFDALSEEFSLASKQEIKEQEISFDMPVDDVLFKALFLNETKDDQVIGPLKIEKDKYALVQINGWIRSLTISEKDARQIKKDVQDKVAQITAKEKYINWIAEKMKGKNLEFNAKTFESLVNIIGPDYFKSEKDKEQAFNKRFWNADNDEMVLNDFAEQLEQILDDPFLTIDNESWTVRRFEAEIKKHPLVFRNKKMSKKDFTKEFKLAIADLIRDKYITEDAYDKGYETDPRVLRNTSMWRDNILSLYQRKNILENAIQENIKPYVLVNEHLNPVFNELRKKYQQQIFINTDEFEKVKLTAVDMFVIQKNMPFPVVVPQFPILTTHNKLDYGIKRNM